MIFDNGPLYPYPSLSIVLLGQDDALGGSSIPSLFTSVEKYAVRKNVKTISVQAKKTKVSGKDDLSFPHLIGRVAAVHHTSRARSVSSFLFSIAAARVLLWKDAFLGALWR